MKLGITNLLLFTISFTLHTVPSSASQIDSTYVHIRQIVDSPESMKIPPSERPTALSPDIALSLLDFKHAQNVHHIPDTHQYAFTLECTPKGSEKLHVLSKASRNKRIAIIVNGEIIASPTIVGELKNGKVSVLVKHPKVSSDTMIAQINRAIQQSGP